MAKIASASGRQGLSTILQTREAPLPFLRDSRVVEACAMIFPPLKGQLCSEQCQWCKEISELTLVSWRLLGRTDHRRLELLLDLSRLLLLRTRYQLDAQQEEMIAYLVC
jgi:hypothetical protein